MSYDDLGKTEYLPFGESVELIKNRQLDATLQSAGLGVASIKDLSVSLPITMVSVPESVAETLGAPFLAATIPAGTYEGQSADVPTLAITNILVTHSDVSEETAYQMTKQLFENLDEMAAAHAAAKAISAEKGAMGLPIPLHPGAERYYKEGMAHYKAESFISAANALRLAVSFDPRNEQYKACLTETIDAFNPWYASMERHETLTQTRKAFSQSDAWKNIKSRYDLSDRDFDAVLRNM